MQTSTVNDGECDGQVERDPDGAAHKFRDDEEVIVQIDGILNFATLRKDNIVLVVTAVAVVHFQNGWQSLLSPQTIETLNVDCLGRIKSYYIIGKTKYSVPFWSEADAGVRKGFGCPSNI